ncbi:ion transporter [Cohnella sp. GCM10027633]|uniref:ion transporter n=1 Tax=unclassified Cohnella TaxID=2636738 RepID=UPI00362E5AC4
MASKQENQGIEGFVKGNVFGKIVLTTVFLNAIMIGIQSYPSIEDDYFSLFRALDLVFLGIFTIEVILKLIVNRGAYFRDGWNAFDFVVVAASLVFITTPFVSVLRILRVLRVLKTISSVPSLRRIITSLFMAVPTISSIALLMSIVFFVYGVIGTTFFGEVSDRYFGDLSKSLVTLFQIATFDDWANIYRPIAETMPLSIVYFLSFIFIVVFVMLNLVVGEIVNNATNITKEGDKKEEGGSAAMIDQVAVSEQAELSELKSLRKEIQEMKRLLEEKVSLK